MSYISRLPFRMAATSMVFGKNVVANARALSDIVPAVEIVLFHTPELHNIPSSEEIQQLKKIAGQKKITFTVHLPASLEIASADEASRKSAVRLMGDICTQTLPLDPAHYVMHIPFSRPTLAPVPGMYFKSGDEQKWQDWTERAMDSLEVIHRKTADQRAELLVENINYSPSFLAPFWEQGPCDFCLDIGHLLLGGENVVEIIQTYCSAIKEIHIHGVRGYEEHISLGAIPTETVRQWFNELMGIPFGGVLNFEVFTPRDLYESMNVVFDAMALDFRVQDPGPANLSL